MPVIGLKYVAKGEAAWPDLLVPRPPEKRVHHVLTEIAVAGLEGGMQSGAPSVALRMDLPDGSTVLAETSLALFLTAADGLRAKFGDPRR